MRADGSARENEEAVIAQTVERGNEKNGYGMGSKAVLYPPTLELGEQGWQVERSDAVNNDVDITNELDQTEDEMIVHDFDGAPYSSKRK